MSLRCFFVASNDHKILSFRYNEPEKLVQKEVNKSDPPAKEAKLNYLQNYLASMKSGTKVFQHFLANSNLSQILEGEFKNVWVDMKIHLPFHFRHNIQLHHLDTVGQCLSTMASYRLGLLSVQRPRIHRKHSQKSCDSAEAAVQSEERRERTKAKDTRRGLRDLQERTWVEICRLINRVFMSILVCDFSVAERQQRLDCLQRVTVERKRYLRHLGGAFHVGSNRVETPPAEQG